MCPQRQNRWRVINAPGAEPSFNRVDRIILEFGVHPWCALGRLQYWSDIEAWDSGRTPTAQELATYAGLRGFQVLWGRCHESRGALSYWP